MRDVDGKIRSGEKYSILFALSSIVPTIFAMSRLSRAIKHFTGKKMFLPLVIFSCITLCFEASMVFFHSTTKIYKAIEWFCGLFSFFIIVYVLMMCLVNSLALPFKWKWNKGNTMPILIFISGIAAVGVVAYGAIHARKLKVKKYKIKIGDNQGYRVVQLSDIHCGPVVGKKYLRDMVKKTNALDPDVIVITGDIFTHDRVHMDKDFRDVVKEMSKLKAKDGVLAVLGNHDPDLDDPVMKKFIKETGIEFIDNKVRETEKVTFVGRTGLVSFTGKREPLDQLMNIVDKDKPVIVLDHDPRGIDEAKKYKVDLIFSGHIHRGQFWPMSMMSKLFNGRRYFYGYDRFGKMHSIISSGTGFFQIPVRLGTDSEIVCADLII